MNVFKKIGLLFFIISIVLIGCRNSNEKKEMYVDQEGIIEYEVEIESPEVLFYELEDSSSLTDHYWSISDGRYYENNSVETYDWVGRMTPNVVFNKVEIPSGSDVYQARLRKDLFYFLYQVEKENGKLYPIGTAYEKEPFDIEFRKNNSNILLFTRASYSGDRVGKQENGKYPLVGTWGKDSRLKEFRLINSIGCYYYMEIDREIPFWAVRRGTYLLRQISEDTFETISAFPDGRLRLEIISEREMLLRPLFTLPEDEEGLVDLLIMKRSIYKIDEYDDEMKYYYGLD